MPTPVWEAGQLYQPGDIVRPASTLPPIPNPPENGNFEDGDTGWTLGTGFSIVDGVDSFDGTWSLQYAGAGDGVVRYSTNDNEVPVNPGQAINAQCQIQQGASSKNRAGGAVTIEWYDASHVFISRSQGNMVKSGSGGAWHQSSLSAVAPAGAQFAKIGSAMFRHTSNPLWADTFSWDYLQSEFPEGLVYTAVQPNAGYSGTTEPTWPVVAGNTVVDNEVTWEAAITTRVVWEATPILVSGASEPDFPDDPDGTVADNTIIWKALDPRVTDPKCPQSKVVAIAASKIFAADDDIIAFSATVNPLDWSTPRDAGFLPFGLQSYGSNPCAAMGLYRGNLVALNAEGYQMWQVDEDPANMAILDSSPVDCVYPRSVQPVGNDLAVLSAEGIRNIGIAGASTNLQAGFFGKQIDPLVKLAINSLSADEEPIGLFWPGAGQYWLFFGVEAFVLTLNGGPKDMSWSRYVFPSAVTDWAILGTELFLRTGDLVWRVSEDALFDDQQEDTEIGGDNVEFEGRMWWPYLDFGQVGVEKQLEAFDLVCSGTVNVQIGYSQKDQSLVTPAYSIDGDTLPGTAVPMPLTGPSFQLRLTFDGGQAWSWNAANMYLLGELMPQ